MPLERIVITFRANGNLRGASATDFDGLPQPLTAGQLNALVPTINAAAVARLLDVDDEISYAKSTFASIETAIADTNLDDTATVAAAQAAIEATKLTRRERRIAELTAQRAKIDADIAALP